MDKLEREDIRNEMIDLEKEELDCLDLDDQMDEVLDEEEDVCPRCNDCGCNYCLMCSY